MCSENCNSRTAVKELGIENNGSSIMYWKWLNEICVLETANHKRAWVRIDALQAIFEHSNNQCIIL